METKSSMYRDKANLCYSESDAQKTRRILSLNNKGTKYKLQNKLLLFIFCLIALAVLGIGCIKLI